MPVFSPASIVKVPSSRSWSIPEPVAVPVTDSLLKFASRQLRYVNRYTMMTSSSLSELIIIKSTLGELSLSLMV